MPGADSADPVSAPPRSSDVERSDDERRRRDFVAWCIRHVGLPWGIILSGVAAGVTYGGSLTSAPFVIRIALFELCGITLGVGLATLAGRVLWGVGIGRHFAAED